MPQGYEKRCPACGIVSPLGAAYCPGCGRAFKTQFVAPAQEEKTQVVPHGWAPPLYTQTPPQIKISKLLGLATGAAAFLVFGTIFVNAAWRAHARDMASTSTNNSGFAAFDGGSPGGSGAVSAEGVISSDVRVVGEGSSVDSYDQSYPLALKDPLDLDLWMHTFGGRLLGENGELSGPSADRTAQAALIGQGRIVPLQPGTKVHIDSVSASGTALVSVLDGAAVGRQGYMHSATLGLR